MTTDKREPAEWPKEWRDALTRLGIQGLHANTALSALFRVGALARPETLQADTAHHGSDHHENGRDSMAVEGREAGTGVGSWSLPPVEPARGVDREKLAEWFWDRFKVHDTYSFQDAVDREKRWPAIEKLTYGCRQHADALISSGLLRARPAVTRDEPNG